MCDELGRGSRPRQGLVIGGIGHRHLSQNHKGLQLAIAGALDTVTAHANTAHLIVSAAEGADRLIIAAAASIELPYICVLPCSPTCFESDFGTLESIAEFRRILANAGAIVQPDCDAVERLSGYQWASNYLVEHADLLLAVWDGADGNGPAGTADTIQRAFEKNIPVLWIPTEPPHMPVVLADTALGIN